MFKLGNATRSGTRRTEQSCSR